MDVSRQLDRVIPTVVGVALAFGLQAYSESRTAEAERVGNVASRAWVREYVGPLQTRGDLNRRSNIRQDQTLARLCERGGISCDLRDAMLRWPGPRPPDRDNADGRVIMREKREWADGET